MLLVVNKNEKPTDRDSYGYKRIEIAGTLISQLFKEYYTKQLKSINLYIDSKFFMNQTMEKLIMVWISKI